MQNNLKFIRKLPIPKDLKERYPLKKEYAAKKLERDAEIANIFTGKDDRLILIIGPCSADREDAVLDYILRLAKLQEKVKDKILFTKNFLCGIYTCNKTLGCRFLITA